MTRQIFVASLSALACAVMTACGSNAISPANTPSSPHPYDFVPEPGSTYVRNDQVQLAREYWLIYEARDGSHHMLPRPDGSPVLHRACGARDELAELLAEARLCQSAQSAEDLERVNKLTRSEALHVSTFLHAKLKFVPAQGDTRPHALISDVVDVCRSFGEERKGGLKAVCDRELGWVAQGSRPDIALELSESEVRALSARLNELYGIK